VNSDKAAGAYCPRCYYNTIYDYKTCSCGYENPADEIDALVEELKQRPKWTFDTTGISPAVVTWNAERFEGTVDECLDWLVAKSGEYKP
jgi:hypothetical protein